MFIAFLCTALLYPSFFISGPVLYFDILSPTPLALNFMDFPTFPTSLVTFLLLHPFLSSLLKKPTFSLCHLRFSEDNLSNYLNLTIKLFYTDHRPSYCSFYKLSVNSLLLFSTILNMSVSFLYIITMSVYSDLIMLQHITRITL